MDPLLDLTDIRQLFLKQHEEYHDEADRAHTRSQDENQCPEPGLKVGPDQDLPIPVGKLHRIGNCCPVAV